MELVKKLPDKQCTSDPLPTWLLKQSVEVLAPFLCRLFNWSLQSGTVPSTFKFAYITPLLKKALDPPARRQIVSTDFQLVRHIEAAGTTN